VAEAKAKAEAALKAAAEAKGKAEKAAEKAAADKAAVEKDRKEAEEDPLVRKKTDEKASKLQCWDELMVTIQSARHLPKMDVMGTCDAFVILDAASSGNCRGRRIHFFRRCKIEELLLPGKTEINKYVYY